MVHGCAELIFGIFLTLGAVASIFYGIFSVRPLTGPLLILPAVFLFLHLWRFLWVLRQSLNLPARTALRSMYNFFSLGWAVTLACIQGLILKKGVFLRTPKSKSQSRLWMALRVTQWESLIGLLFLGFGLAAFVVRPEIKTFWLGLLLAWQASLFLAAPYYSLLSVQAGPARGVRQVSMDRGQAVAENNAAQWVWGAIIAIVAIAWVSFQIPLPSQPPSYAIYEPANIPPQALIGLNPTDIQPTPTALPLITETPTGTPLSSPTETPMIATPTEATPTLEPPTPTIESTQTNILCTPTFTFAPAVPSSTFTPTSIAIPTPLC